MSNIELSIVVPVYNHEAYIEECLNSILMQKVNFNYEVLIGEDCSTDGTRALLLKIEKNYPDYFKFYYNDKNLGMGPGGNAYALRHKTTGKYKVMIEGDDYWLYDKKLQHQYDFLENNPDYIAIAHRCTVVDHNSQKTGGEYPDCKHAEYTIDDFFHHLLPGQTATIMCRAELYEKFDQFNSMGMQRPGPGDRKLAFLMPLHGRVKCLPQAWSAYRFVTTHGTSYSATSKRDLAYKINTCYFYQNTYLYAKSIQNEHAAILMGRIYYKRYLALCFDAPNEFNVFSLVKLLCLDDLKWKYIRFLCVKSEKSFIHKLVQRCKGKKKEKSGS